MRCEEGRSRRKTGRRRQGTDSESEEGGKDIQMTRWKSCGQHLTPDRRRGPVVGHSLWTRPARVQSPWEARIIRCKNLALYIRDCESLCLSDETVKAVGPFYLVSMPGEVKYPTHSQGVSVNTEIHRNTLETPKYTEIHRNTPKYTTRHVHTHRNTLTTK